MRKRSPAALVIFNLIAFTFLAKNPVLAMAMVQEKTEIGGGVSPPEGNSTFVGGTTWCVARASSPPADLQVALDWACGKGQADCRAIRAGGPCFEPDTLIAHASFAFNSYYQQNGNSDIACYFGGTAALTRNDPSYSRCMFSTSESIKASSAASNGEASSRTWWNIAALVRTA
ncbi:glucan endo-1,3-beta-glucosidase 13-like isoform X2 [Andrographis paniculata]|uniref:glucan endo-1,3-beta-glucosidase 13-like isoform X2 n=1 Tax=Andrographis paniculata TaxID=175694 RepID=UPI0021E6FEF0|nr:glucan endo-1,3-beta-glucosidase 13-like isoform X2 [Andrographis paniculata]